MIRTILNIYNLSIKELKTLFYDKVMVLLVIYSFSFAIYIGGTQTSTELHNASIAFVDSDKSTLSTRIVDAFYKPRFNTPHMISYDEVDEKMDSGYYSFIVLIPSSFEQDIISGKTPDILVSVDATRMTQAGIGSGYIQNIINQEVQTFLKGSYESSVNPKIISRYKYNPNLTTMWFGSINEIINNIVMISILLSGAALVREREHGTIEHLLVMPLRAFEIMLSKILSTCLVILFCVTFSLLVVIETILQIPLNGSIPLYLLCTFLVLFATTSMGVFMGTIVKNMPQLGMIFILTILPLMLLSGSITPYESMPMLLQDFMQLMPTSHFVDLSQAILFKGAGITIIWKKMLIIFIIGSVFFILTLMLFKKSLGLEN
jgi:ABC-2 type transport system permease protein